MRKMLVVLFAVLIMIPLKVDALSSNTRDVVTLSSCIDSTSARFIQNGNEIKTKFIGIDVINAMESNENDEISTEFVDNFVCDLLKSAKKIELELEAKSDIKDKYDRYIVWVFLDDSLLQNSLVNKGYAKTFYLYEDYKYYNMLKQSEASAKEEKLGLWYVKEKVEEPIVVSKKDESIFDALLSFINKVFEKILKFVDDLLKNVFN